MNWIMRLVLAATITVAATAQNTPQRTMPLPGRVGTQANSEHPSTNNYQLELRIKRGDKEAKYLMVLSGGQISTELVDRTAKKGEEIAPQKISFNLSLMPFENGKGAEATVFVGRSLVWRSGVQQAANQTGRSIIQEIPIGLTTNAALFFEKPVVLFDDGEDKITLKLTQFEGE